MNPQALHSFHEALKQATYGIADGQLQNFEEMTGPRWKQTMRDVPGVIAAGALGWGLGATALELVGDRLARTGNRPAWLGYIPPAMALASAVTPIAQDRIRTLLRERRDRAEMRASKHPMPGAGKPLHK